MKVYFNTNVFDEIFKQSQLRSTADPKEATLLVLGAKKIDYSKFTNLKAIYRFGVGDDNIDYKFTEKNSIRIYFPSDQTKEVLYNSTANFTVYAILYLLYNGAFGKVDSWIKKQRSYLGDKVALIIGLGNIGQKVFDRLRPFMKVTTYDIKHNKESELEALIKEADIITIHIPLIDENKLFFDVTKLSWIKNEALIINTSRGLLFDENALYGKLIDSNCRAFFDVFWQEPYNGKLKGLGSDKFFMTPHTASNTKEFVYCGFRDILEIIRGLEND